MSKKSKKLSLIFVCMILALGAITAGFCFVFLGNQKIDDKPASLKVDNVGGEFYLVAQYSGKYDYQFKLEQKVDGNWLLVDVVDSTKNAIKLSAQKLNVVAGQDYRFSACFIYENSKGQFCDEILWCPSWTLPGVDETTIDYDDETGILSWGKVNMADSYTVKFVDGKGDAFSKNCDSNSLNLDGVVVGQYRIYVFANSNNSKIFSSFAGDGKNIWIARENQILSVERQLDNSLIVSCSQKVDAFNVFVDGVLKGKILTSNATENENVFTYTLTGAGVILGQCDFSTEKVEIQSVEGQFVFESDLFQIV